MQKKTFLLLVITFSYLFSSAQIDSLSKRDKAAIDSMMQKDEFLKLLNDKTKNSLDLGIGIGNGAFSAHNNAANATGVDNKLIFTPSIVYRLKSGFNFGVTAFLTNDTTSNSKLYQTGLNIGYDYTRKNVDAGIAYTRFFSDGNKYNNKSIYQNDIYGYIKKASGIIQPGLALGFDNGKYKEADVASVILKRPLNPRGDTTVTGIDSTNNSTNYFSATVSIEHDFSFYTLFSKDDELDFIPSLMLNFGRDDLTQTQTHTNTVNRPALKKLLAKRKKNAPDNKFEMQSVAASFDFNYGVGKFFLQPDLYLDYYLPQTKSKRLSVIFSITAGLTF